MNFQTILWYAEEIFDPGINAWFMKMMMWSHVSLSRAGLYFDRRHCDGGESQVPACHAFIHQLCFAPSILWLV